MDTKTLGRDLYGRAQAKNIREDPYVQAKDIERSD